MTATKKLHKPGPARTEPVALSKVEPATVQDFQDLVYFLYRVREEIDDGDVEQDLLAELVKALVNRQYGIAFIVRGPTGIEASLGVILERPRLGRKYRLRSVWNVVIPAARRTTGHAKSLLATATAFADQIGREFYLETWTQPERTEFAYPQGEIGPCNQCGRQLHEFLDKSPKARLCSRYLPSAGRIFAYSPQDQTSAN